MSNLNAELVEIRTARASLQKFRLKLLRPSVAVLQSGSTDLALAIECLRQLEPVLSSQGPRPAVLERALGLEVSGLRRELAQVNALMEGAGKFYEGWARLLFPTSDDGAANYALDGKPRASVANRSNTVVIHG
jgi:hypothetical protein